MVFTRTGSACSGSPPNAGSSGSEGDQLQSFASASPLAVNRVLAIYEDREGDLWLGTDSGGLHVLRDQKFTTYTTADGLSGNFVRCVFQSSEGELWIGTDGAGLNRRTSTGFAHYSTAEGLSSNVILSLAGGAGDDLWIGTPNGLNLLHQGKIRRFTSADGLPDDFIRSLYTDRDGSLWIGTRHGCRTWRPASSPPSPAWTAWAAISLAPSCAAVRRLASGPLWIGTSAGLSRLQNDTFTNITVAAGALRQHGHRDSPGHPGNALAGNQRRRPEPPAAKGGSEPFPPAPRGCRAPSTACSRTPGRLWLSSKTGIFRVSIAALNAYASGAAHAIAVDAYGTADGMNIRECSGGGHPAAWKLADGSLWFATLDGVSFIDPAHAPENRVPHRSTLKRCWSMTRFVGPGRELTIQPGPTGSNSDMPG